MVGFELKAIVVILLIASILINGITYDDMTESGMPKPRFWWLMLLSISLFIYGLYLNENPIILF